MPCEACNQQFTVFKRKKSCTECRRLYCSNCLTKNKERILCKRCVIFTTRPLSKIELLKLRAKDLIFYLQSKHISTTGCVEKEELVNLVLIHVDSSNNSFSPDSQHSHTSFNSATMGTDHSGGDDARANPFDQIRNTCQNLFSTFTEKIASDFNFDFKPNQSDHQSNVCEDQPRYSNFSQNAPTFNSNSNSNSNSTVNNNGSSRGTATAANSKGTTAPQRPTTINQTSANAFHTGGQNNQNTNNRRQISPTNNTGMSSGSSAASTPSLLRSSGSHSNYSITGDSNGTQIKSMKSPPPPSNEHERHIKSPTASTATASTSANNNKNIINRKPACAKVNQLSKVNCCNDSGSCCECSDDELIVKFREAYSSSDQPLSSPVSIDSVKSSSTITAENKPGSSSIADTLPVENCCSFRGKIEDASALENLDISLSFEDLGAVGGNVGGTSTLVSNTNESNNDTDKWQFINRTWNVDDTASTSSNVDTTAADTNKTNETSIYTTNLPNSITELPQNANINAMQENQRRNQDEPIDDDSEMIMIKNQTFHIHSNKIATTVIALIIQCLMLNRVQRQQRLRLLIYDQSLKRHYVKPIER